MDAPRRFWHITLFMSDGREYRRYIKCPYLVEADEDHGGKAYRRPLAPGDPDYPDTLLAVTARLGALEWDRVLASYRVSPVPGERIEKVRHLAVRWREVEAALIAA
jgi:hypothetical protein